jgi:SAM-dependent methyltransferase
MSYSPALFDDMFGYAGNPLVRRALEIGCGTGQATRAVATRRIPVVCIEPGPNLATLAQQNLADFTNVRVVCSSFEEWILEPEPFDLVFSANAESGCFEEFAKLRYEGSQIYAADSYAELLFTLQRYHHIPGEIRSERLRSVRDIIRDGGGTIRVKYVTHLLLARKKTQRPWWKRFFPSRSISPERN